MGIIVGKFRRKPSTYDILTNLDNEIKTIESFQKSTEEARKRTVFSFILFAVLIYVIFGILLYLYFSDSSTDQKLYCGAALIAFPIVIWIFKRLLTWYYNRKIKRNENKLISLKERKKKILENVMETETYKVAKKILDKFGTDSENKMLNITPTVPKVPTIVAKPTGTVLRQRNVMAIQQALPSRLSFGGLETPVVRRNIPGTPSIIPSSAIRTRQNVNSQVANVMSPMPQLPRGILPRDRSALDKIMDFLVGDGPSNRYALICKECHAHNGMATADEFEYLSYCCCYCTAFNPSRKKKPSSPQHNVTTTSLRTRSSSGDSSSSESDENESKPELKPTKESLDVRSRKNSESPDTAKTSEFDKLSDLEQKNSDNDASPALPMDVDVDLRSRSDNNNDQEETIQKD